MFNYPDSVVCTTGYRHYTPKGVRRGAPLELELLRADIPATDITPLKGLDVALLWSWNCFGRIFLLQTLHP
jgi:hypothetical protein